MNTKNLEITAMESRELISGIGQEYEKYILVVERRSTFDIGERSNMIIYGETWNIEDASSCATCSPKAGSMCMCMCI